MADALPNPVATTENPLEKAKELLKKIRESNWSKSSELTEFRALLAKEGKFNEMKTQELKKLLVNELAKPIRTQEEWNARDYTNPTE